MSEEKLGLYLTRRDWEAAVACIEGRLSMKPDPANKAQLADVAGAIQETLTLSRDEVPADKKRRKR